MIIIKNKTLFNSNFLILEILYQNKVQLNDEIFCSLSQEEIAKELNISRMSVSNAVRKLIEDGYINVPEGKNKCYILTAKALDTMKILNEL